MLFHRHSFNEKGNVLWCQCGKVIELPIHTPEPSKMRSKGLLTPKRYDKKHRKPKKGRAVTMVNMETGEAKEFISVSSCARKMKCDQSFLRKRIELKLPYDGYRIAYS